MNRLIFEILLSVFVLNLINTEACELPEPKEDVDWNKISGSWYLAVHSKDSVMTEDVACSFLQNMIPAEDGMRMMVTNYLNRTCFNTHRPHMIRQRKGVYRVAEEEVHTVVEAQEYTATGELNKAAKEEDEYTMRNGIVYLTDYEKYFIHVTCGVSGELIVWGTAPTPNTTADDVIAIWNGLVENGVSVKLYLSGCSQVDISH